MNIDRPVDTDELVSILSEEKSKLKELSEKIERQNTTLNKIQSEYEDLSERFLFSLKVLNQMYEVMVPMIKVIEEYKNHTDPNDNEWVAKNFNHRKRLLISQAGEAVRHFDYFKDSSWGTKTYIG